LGSARLDVQWGAAGDHWNLTGFFDPASRRRFEILAGIAGAKLDELSGWSDLADVPRTEDDATRWIHALRLSSGSFRMGDIGESLAEDGRTKLLIYTGSVERVADVSANFCLALEAASARRLAGRLDDALASPRYAGIGIHWPKARQFRDQEDPDLANAAKEAVSALEAMAQVLAGETSITLGACLKKIRQESRLHPTLIKSLESFWGYTSDAPGVRHGSPLPASITPAEVDFVMASCEAGIRLLLSLDGPA
jgi:hypothetical protein